MKKLLTINVILILLITSSCDITNSESIKGSGNVITTEIEFSDFSKIEAGYAFKINIIKGDAYSVIIRIDDNINKYLEVNKEGNTLKIFLEEGNSYNNVTLEANITLPDIENVNFSGAVDATISGFEFEHGLGVMLSGASNLTSNIITGDITFKISGASKATLKGSGENLNAIVSGASNLQLGNFTIINADANLSGASTSTINISGLLNATLSGASNLYYYGNPTMGDINLSGASAIHNLN